MPITFDLAVQTCTALGQFAAAREQGDKDLILMVEKVDGRESLKTIRISALSWQQRFVRQLGFGNATLTAVSTCLSQNEPCLPPWFSDLRYLSTQGCMTSSTEGPSESWHTQYTDLSWVHDVEEGQFEQMKAEKSCGVARLKGCIERYQKSRLFEHIFNFAVYVPTLQEYEKIDIRREINPIGFFSHEGKSDAIMPVNYKASPTYLNSWPIKNTVGFCYEYGIGVERDLAKAKQCYVDALCDYKGEPHFSPLINLGRVCLKEGDKTSAIANFAHANIQLIRLLEEIETAPRSVLPRRFYWIGGSNIKEALRICQTAQEKVDKELTHLTRTT